MSSRLIIKAILITLMVPGTVTLLLPFLILRQSGIVESPLISSVAILMGIIGFALLLHCIWGFAVHGKGTLAPIDPPTVLVVRGLYRYTRNPMYLAVITVLLSEALLFGSASLLLYAAAVFLIFHLFVVLYEEPHLRLQFGISYEKYYRAVPRWSITMAGFTSDVQSVDPKTQ